MHHRTCRVSARRGLRLRRGTPAVPIPVRSLPPEAGESRCPARISLRAPGQTNTAPSVNGRRLIRTRKAVTAISENNLIGPVAVLTALARTPGGGTVAALCRCRALISIHPPPRGRPRLSLVPVCPADGRG